MTIWLAKQKDTIQRYEMKWNKMNKMKGNVIKLTKKDKIALTTINIKAKQNQNKTNKQVVTLTR